jgi:ATP-dependent RNA helicase RhlE
MQDTTTPPSVPEIPAELAKVTFEDFPGLDPRCLSVLHAMKIVHPTPVQAAAIPIALTGKDLIATAQTGTGKTLAFTLPSLTRLGKEPDIHNRMLVLLPTRELCMQVEEVAHQFARALHLKSALIYGGVGMQPQTDDLKRGVDIIVATPGRLLDHMGRGYVNFKNLEILVFDEADRMLDMGFMPDIKRILSKLPSRRQTLMFSATFAPTLQRLAQDMMYEPERIEIGSTSKPVERVRQLIVPVTSEEKLRLLLYFLSEEEHNVGTSIIFLRTKHRTDRLARTLKKEGFRATAIHGDLSQAQRQRALEGFREGKYEILVATDVAARGIDIDDVSHVFNYDIPETPDDYMHRIGRTARAERDGDAITFVAPAEAVQLEGIERTLGKTLPRFEYEDMPMVMSLYKPAGAPRKPTLTRGRRRR